MDRRDGPRGRGCEPAVRIRTVVVDDEKPARDRLKRWIERVLSPLSATVALDSSWALEAEGKPDEAAAVLREAAKRGVPLP